MSENLQPAFGFDASKLLQLGFQVEFKSHASAIMQIDFPEAWSELESCLIDLKIPITEIIGSGGGEAKGTQRLRRSLASNGWKKHNFVIEKTINGIPRESISHEVDHVKDFGASGVIALEIEWNNKDPFFDRDLENYKRLHAEGAISIGVLITRGTTLQRSIPKLVTQFLTDNDIEGFEKLESYGYTPTARQKKNILDQTKPGSHQKTFVEAFVRQFVADKYGAATTHWSKLEDRIHRGVGNPCPLLLIGLPESVVTFDKLPD